MPPREVPVKSLHRPDLFQWSVFDEARNVDFHTTVWVRAGGNVVVDPLPWCPHDLAHLKSVGGAAWVVLTNGDHLRATVDLVRETEARIAAPIGERGKIGIPVDRWIADGEEIVPGLRAYALEGSKTNGELALHLAPDTLITGDLVRGQRAGRLNLLPAEKLTDADAVRRSIARLAAIAGVENVLVGDGWPVFGGGSAQLARLLG